MSQLTIFQIPRMAALEAMHAEKAARLRVLAMNLRKWARASCHAACRTNQVALANRWSHLSERAANWQYAHCDDAGILRDADIPF